MKLKDIKSEDVKRLLAVKSCKIDFKYVTESDIKNISEINLSGKRLDGSKSDIDLDVISIFPSLTMLGISNFHISQEIVDNILRNRNLCSLEFTDCTFDQIDFGDINPDFNLRLRGSRDIPFKYPALRKVNIIGSTFNFDIIDLENAIVLNLMDSRVFGIEDLSDFENIERVNFDGSTLYDKEEKVVPDVKVSQCTEYSHKQRLELYDRMQE